jgi:hypothetical protein
VEKLGGAILPGGGQQTALMNLSQSHGSRRVAGRARQL